LDLNLQVDVLFERCLYLVGGQLGETLFEEMDLEFYIEVLLLEVVDVLK
jgi:hypothetical protein